MTNDPKLEQFLTALDKNLGQISVGDRADIITEIRAHVLETVERNPDQQVGQILAALGAPEEVANRYLLERGLKPGKPAKGPVVKWLTVGALGTLALFLTFVVILVWKFSPVVEIDAAKKRVSILGGMVSVDGTEGTLSVANTHVREGKGGIFDGAKDLAGTAVRQVRVPFKNGKLVVRTSVDSQLRWNCKAGGGSGHPTISETDVLVTLDFTETDGMKCDLQVPKLMKLELQGTNGQISFERPEFPTKVDLANGKIRFMPAAHVAYRFQNNVENGRIVGLVSSAAAEALLIELSMVNGLIQAE